MWRDTGQLCVTGIGTITPLGIGAASLWDGYERWCRVPRPSILREIQRVQKPSGAAHFPDKVGIDHLSKSSLCVCVSAQQAIQQSGLDLGRLNKTRVGVSIGSAFASANAVQEFSEKILKEGPESIEPVMFPNTVSNAAAGYLGAMYGFTGLNITFSAGINSSSIAISYACEAIVQNIIDIAIAGGVEEFVDGQDSVNGIEGCSLIVIERVQDATHRSAPQLGYLASAIAGEVSKEREVSWPATMNRTNYGGLIDRSNRQISEQVAEFIAQFHGASTAIGCALGIASKQPFEIRSASWDEVVPPLKGSLIFTVQLNGNDA